jgi:hypothetical protein
MNVRLLRCNENESANGWTDICKQGTGHARAERGRKRSNNNGNHLVPLGLSHLSTPLSLQPSPTCSDLKNAEMSIGGNVTFM